MTTPPRTASHGTFFITAPAANRCRLFQVTRTAELFLETLQHYRQEGHYRLHAFVAMPDHVHLLLTPQTITIERTMQLIKAASRIGWRRSFRSGSAGTQIIVCATTPISRPT